MARTTDIDSIKTLIGKKLKTIQGDMKNSEISELLTVSTSAYADYLNGISTPPAGKLWRFILRYAADNDKKMINLNWLMDDNDYRLGPVFVGEGDMLRAGAGAEGSGKEDGMLEDDEGVPEKSPHHLMVANNLRVIRARLGVEPWHQLCRDAEVDGDDWLRWEADDGAPTRRKLEKIATFVGIDPIAIDRPLPKDEWPQPTPLKYAAARDPGDMKALMDDRRREIFGGVAKSEGGQSVEQLFSRITQAIEGIRADLKTLRRSPEGFEKEADALERNFESLLEILQAFQQGM